ncbi:protein-L-isoaspartate(D-aspartate) O-methyltransferase, partial [Candidatus Woesearchaeota archaeon]|nr:protein-L-isoaspartate(D-aspartate) O-methyltransferase [Candidatus Woesearchaeota archaeon]
MESNIGLLNYWEKTGMITDKRLLDAFEKTRREDFILKEYENEAYGDYPLPIGHEQTISQPTTVMLMLKFLEAKPNHKVLEIGAGSGYNAAILSRLCKKVYCVERIKELADFAKSNLKKAKIENVEVIHADGSKGYKEKAPYDKIMITAAVPQIPQP